MPQRDRKVVCLAERGWEGIRNLTLFLAGEGISSLCVIKGRLDEEVLDMITKYEPISLFPISRSIFKLYIFMMFFRNFFLRNTLCVVLDNRKNYSWVGKINRFFGIKTILLEERPQGYRLFWQSKPIDRKFILNLAGG